MTKKILLTLVLVIGLVCLVGCGDKAEDKIIDKNSNLESASYILEPDRKFQLGQEYEFDEILEDKIILDEGCPKAFYLKHNNSTYKFKLKNNETYLCESLYVSDLSLQDFILIKADIVNSIDFNLKDVVYNNTNNIDATSSSSIIKLYNSTIYFNENVVNEHQCSITIIYNV